MLIRGFLRGVVTAGLIFGLAGCSTLLTTEPEGTPIVSSEFPAHQLEGGGEAWAHQAAQSFSAWVAVEGDADQRAAVAGHVELVTGEWSEPGGLAYIRTDHTNAADAASVALAFTQWEDNADRAVRVAVYGSDGALLYANCTEPGTATPPCA
jgi:hypothetical protein